MLNNCDEHPNEMIIPKQPMLYRPSLVTIDNNDDDYQSTAFDDLITINVAGARFQTHRRTLDRYPTTLLGSAHRRQRYFNARNNELFFDRHRTAFEAILYIYQSGGRVKRPDTVPIDLFLRELRFFQMGAHFIEQFWISEGYEKPKEALMPTRMLQRRAWELMEYPDSSLYARIMAFTSVAVIIW
jgi:hypothetical protein